MALVLPRHTNVFQALQPFAELILWLKSARPNGYRMLADVRTHLWMESSLKWMCL